MGFVEAWVLAAVAVAAGPAGPDGTQAVSPAVVQTAAAAVRPAPAVADPVATAQRQMRAITDGVGRIRRLVPLAENRAVRMSCVMQHLVEAKIHVQLADQEMAVFVAAPADAGKADGAKPAAATAELGARRLPAADDDARAYALLRLDLIAKRTVELERAARVCVDDDLSSIDVTEVHVEKGGKK